MLIQIQHLLKLNKQRRFSSSEISNSNTTLVKVKLSVKQKKRRDYTIQIQHLLKLNGSLKLHKVDSFFYSNTTLVKVK